MSAQHKKALAEGRTRGRAVKPLRFAVDLNGREGRMATRLVLETQLLAIVASLLLLPAFSALAKRSSLLEQLRS